MTEYEQPETKGISRRTIVKGAAWAVPAIAIAAPVPAFAGASQGTIELTGGACKLPGNSSFPYNTNGAVYLMRVTNTTNSSSTITITEVERSGSINTNVVFSVVRLTGAGTCCTQLGNTFTVNANSSDLFALVTGGWDNSSNGMLTVHYNIGAEAQTPATTQPGSLEPVTPGGANCNTGGACSITSVAIKQCILKAVNVPECSGVGGCS